jgi:hypothetical protein
LTLKLAYRPEDNERIAIVSSVAPLPVDTTRFERIDVVLVREADQCVVASAEQVIILLFFAIL